jgi:signal peptidase I
VSDLDSTTDGGTDGGPGGGGGAERGADHSVGTGGAERGADHSVGTGGAQRGAEPSGGTGGGTTVGTANADEAAGRATGPAAHAAPRRSGSFLRELPFLVVVALALALLIKAFLVQAFFIPSGSMEQTLEIKDRVLVNKLVYDFRDVHRGEIIVFDGKGSFTEPETVLAPPSNGLQRALRAVTGFLGLGAPGEKDFIKRVIGVGGDRVACCTNGHVTVQPKGSSRPVELVEPYVYTASPPSTFCQGGDTPAACPPGAAGVLVPNGRLWVMGDHRDASRDSRAYMSDANSGTIPVDQVIGRAFVIVLPVSRWAVLRVPSTFDGPLGAVPVAAAVAMPYVAGLVGALPVVAGRRRLRRRH